MNFKKITKAPKKELYQIISFSLVFIIFILSFVINPSTIFYYIFILAALSNIIFGIINKKGNTFLNIVLFIIALFSSIPWLGYMMVLIGILIIVPYFIVFIFKYFKD